MKRWLRDNSLGLVMLLCFAVFMGAQSVTGHWHYNEEQETHGQPTSTYTEYIASGEFIESFQNWQSEFLAVASIVILSVYLRQKGSPESKPVNTRTTKPARSSVQVLKYCHE